MAIKIMVDSAADISKKEAEELGIIVVPMLISFGEEEYYDGIDLSPAQFYEKLIKSNIMPKTSQITPFRFEEEFKRHIENGDELIVITISSKLSGTYEGARKTAEKFNGKVHVIDSFSAAIGERLLCQYALKMIGENKSAQDIEDELNKVKGKINIMAVLGTLTYLKKGGRISSAVAFAGELLSIKPIVAVIDGEVKLIGKALGTKKGYKLLNKFVLEKGGIDFSMPYGTIWSGIDNTIIDKFINDSDSLWDSNSEKVPSYILGATIGAHVGPGTVGIAFFSK